tara:strand:+ start:250 stop:432 length:183 start_codon:yes stop_codon:yes gene_type:complete
MKKENEMKMEDYYTKDEIDYICMYYGQIPDNLSYYTKAILVEKYEDEIGSKIEEIQRRKS